MTEQKDTSEKKSTEIDIEELKSKCETGLEILLSEKIEELLRDNCVLKEELRQVREQLSEQLSNPCQRCSPDVPKPVIDVILAGIEKASDQQWPPFPKDPRKTDKSIMNDLAIRVVNVYLNLHRDMLWLAGASDSETRCAIQNYLERIDKLFGKCCLTTFLAKEPSEKIREEALNSAYTADIDRSLNTNLKKIFSDSGRDVSNYEWDIVVGGGYISANATSGDEKWYTKFVIINNDDGTFKDLRFLGNVTIQKSIRHEKIPNLIWKESMSISKMATLFHVTKRTIERDIVELIKADKMNRME